MMLRAMFALSGGVTFSAVVGIESLIVLQDGFGEGNSLDSIQVGFLISSIVLLLMAGKLYGTWVATQAQLDEKVDKLVGENQELQKKVSILEGTVGMMKKRDSDSIGE